jgi:ABC-type branched-subunit amino acid transport system ATPase component
MLSVSHIDVHYGDIQVIYDLSFEVEKGEIYALFGRNGAGKTTTLKSCLNLVKNTAGKITFDNKDITHMEPHEICYLGVGFTFQERCVFPTLSVREHFSLVDKNVFGTRNVKTLFNEAVDIFPDLEPLLNRNAAALSGGEAQMVKLAMAIVRKPMPKLLLLDEPSTGLSPENIIRLSDKLRSLKGETTIVIVEQVIGAAIGITDSYAVIRDGAIIHESRVNDIEKEEDIVQKYILGLQN